MHTLPIVTSSNLVTFALLESPILPFGGFGRDENNSSNKLLVTASGRIIATDVIGQRLCVFKEGFLGPYYSIPVTLSVFYKVYEETGRLFVETEDTWFRRFCKLE